MDDMKKTILLILPAVLLAGCTVKEKEKEITVFRNTVTSVYTGKVKHKLPEGEGQALLDNNASVTGLFEQGTLVSGEAVSVPYTITHNDLEISGLYTGEVSDELPAGTGTFESEFISYNGSWVNGVPDGPGVVTAERFRIDSPSGILEGSYSGDVRKGLAEGTGTFVYLDGDLKTEMTGSFAGSQFDGLLVKTVSYEDTAKSYPVYYQKGEQLHDTAAMLAYLEGMRNESYCLSEEQLSFISDHTSLFEGKTSDTDLSGLYNSTFDEEAFQEGEEPSLILIRNATVRSIQRYKPYDGADTVTSMIVQNSGGWYHLVFAWSVSSVDQGSTADICALPLCRSTLTAPEQDYPAIDCAGAVIMGR